MSDFNIKEFGAEEGRLCTREIQRAIELCEKGGRVVIPKGRFTSGALYLKSDMTLFLEDGAYLLASGDIADFPVIEYAFEGRDCLCYASLLNTDSAPHKNITIEGKGTIDACGTLLYRAELDENKGKRGRAVYVRNTENLTIRGVTIRQSPAWCLHIHYCNNVTVDGVKIYTKYAEDGSRYKLHNGDGIDVDACSQVSITNCLIESQDDCIAIKSGRDEEGRRVGIPSKGVLVENCRFTSGFGVAVGSEMSGGVENVTVRNCRFENTYSVASIKAIRGRGGYVKNISFENCEHFNYSDEHHDCEWFKGAIYVDGFYGSIEADEDKKEPINEGTPLVDGVSFKNISVDTTAGRAVYLCGLPESKFKNISFENVKAKGKGGLKAINLEGCKLHGLEVCEY